MKVLRMQDLDKEKRYEIRKDLVELLFKDQIKFIDDRTIRINNSLKPHKFYIDFLTALPFRSLNDFSAKYKSYTYKYLDQICMQRIRSNKKSEILLPENLKYILKVDRIYPDRITISLISRIRALLRYGKNEE